MKQDDIRRGGGRYIRMKIRM